MKEDLTPSRDDLDLRVEKTAEPGEAPLDEEDDGEFPWEPSLREKPQQQSRTTDDMLTHYPQNRYCDIVGDLR